MLLFDTRDGAAEAAKAKLAGTLDGLVAKGRMTPEVKAAALAWVPNAMRFPDAHTGSASSPATEDASDIGDDFADGGEPGVPGGSAAGELEGADA